MGTSVVHWCMPEPGSIARSRCWVWLLNKRARGDSPPTAARPLEGVGLVVPTPRYPVPSRIERCLDLLFPPTCVECRRVGRWICPRCWTNVSWVVDLTCGSCGMPSVQNPCSHCAHRSSSLRSVVAVAPFEGAAREAVHALKYEGKHAIAPVMGRLMGRAVRDLEIDLVVATPLHA